MATDHDTWINSGNPLDQEDPPVDIKLVEQTLLDIAEEVRLYPENWTKGALARNTGNEKVSVIATDVSSWSIFGFLAREFYDHRDRDDLVKESAKALKSVVGTDISEYNDSLTNSGQFIEWVTKAAQSLES